jgi:phosphoglycolate phosphatase-like HAD superfamily hydrolase
VKKITVFSFTPQHDFLVAIDSDGCTFDTMEVKHKECFIPCFINHYNLQAVSRFAREAWEFVNLYSRSRGVNRFPALVETLQWLQRRPEVPARKVKIDLPASVLDWVKTETRLGNPALEARVKETNDPALGQCLAWSQAVNKAIDDMVRHVPPFPFVRESLQKLQGKADLVVCSATPSAALKKEWTEHQIDGLVSEICGQEQGTKKELLAQARKYLPDHALMVGDALGDYAAAQANACLFFPINPGAEDASWERFHREGIDRFLSGQFAGEYQDSLLAEFRAYLPEKPNWRFQ